MIDKKTIEDIRFQNDIAEVVGSYLNLQKAGASFKAPCPFHKEKTPSFFVNPERQIYHCFGCGAGGDVFRFVMEYEAVEFVDAARMLAERVGIHIEYDGAGGTAAEDKAALYSLMEQAAAFYQRVLTESPHGKPALSYLDKRNVPRQALKDFMVGFVPERWDSIVTWGHKRKYTTEQLELAGLIIKSTKPRAGSQGYYDRFRNRIMFPIRDTQGRVIGFSGRTLNAEVDKAKYVNTPETPLFHKGRVFYGLYESKREIIDAKESIICEGQLDVIRCHSCGFKTAVAPLGTAFTEDHARVLKRWADAAVIAFDSDSAGKIAAVKTARILMQAGIAVRAAQLPDGDDPDTFLSERPAEEFRDLLNTAPSALEFQVRFLETIEDRSSEVGLMRMSRSVLDTITQSPNAVQRARLIQQGSELLGIPASALEEELKHAMRKAVRPRRTAQDTAKPASRTTPREERELAEHVVAEPGLGRLVEDHLPESMFTDNLCAGIIKCAARARDEEKDLMQIVREQPDPEGALARLAAELQMAPNRAKGPEASREQAVKDIVLCLWRKKIENERAELLKTPTAERSKNIEERLRQVPFDLKALRDWETGSPIIEIEMAE